MIWTPTTAMLWECWRLSRRGLGISMTTATFVGWAVLSIESPAIYAMVFAAMFAWLGQGWAVVIDKRKRFTFAPGFTRPVATWKLALVPLAFVAIESAVSYLVPVSILGTAFGISFPLLPMAALCATISVTWTFFLWHASDLVVRRIMGIIVMIGWLWATPAVFSSGTPQIVSRIAPGEYAAMVFTCVVAFAMAVFGVARLRCGDDRIGLDWFASIRSRSRTHTGLMSLLSHRMRVPCPVSSPVLAQLWFEFHTVGGRVAKSTALFMAIMGLTFFLTSNSSMSTEARLVVLLWAGIALPMWLTVRSLFGLQRMQGHTRSDVFAGARPIGTARLVALKVLAGSLVLYTAWAALAAGLWVFQRWIAGPEMEWAIVVDYFPYLVELGFVEGRPGSPPRVPGAAVSVAIQAIAVMAGAAAFHALFALYAKRIMQGAVAVMLYTILIVTMVNRGWIAGDLTTELHLGVLVAAIVIGTSFILWRGLAERIFSSPGVVFIVVIGLAFAITANMVWADSGSVDDRIIGLLIGLMPLSAMALAPWSFSRLRHR